MNVRRRFGQLRWKLTLSYTLVTVGALLVVEFLLIGGGTVLFDWLLVRSGMLAQITFQVTEESYVPALRPYLLGSTPNEEGVDLWLRQFEARVAEDEPATMIVLGGDGRVLGTVSSEQPSPGPQLEPIVAAALSGETDPRRLAWHDEVGQQLWLASPITAAGGDRVLGVLVQNVALPRSPAALMGEVLPVVGISLLVLTLLAGTVGTVFGGLTARGLGQRLSRLADATRAWSRGDFSVFVADGSADELGQLARHLNQMAEQLQNLLATRQQLAVLEERNRLARELHDSAKQQAFAMAAQLAAARALLRHDPEGAEARLSEAERLAYDLRQELTNLVHELRPMALEDKGLARALREYTRDWSQRNTIAVDVEAWGEQPLPLVVEGALFRIAQEALANVARHSAARQVTIRLQAEGAAVTLAIADDGRGFDVPATRQGVGLSSMQERAAALGANLTVTSEPGRGACVSVRCPIHPE